LASQGLRWLAGLALALAACASPGGPGQVTGSVSYRERVALPPDSVVRVTLLDVSLLDVPARMIAEQEIRPAAQVPIPFALAYDRAAIDPARRYALRAAISDEKGRPLWTTATAQRVLTAGAPDDVQLVLERVSAGGAPAGPRLLAYVCDGFAFRVEVTRERALLFLPGRSQTLAAVPAASGAKYEGGSTIFWSKRDEATLWLDGAEYVACKLQRRPLP
jgi:putative lipoprotein